jgi:CRISPR/Cas system-associated protein Cas7 (RAMP superfamily)
MIQFTANVATKEPISVSIVPNPATDFIQISMNGIESASFKMVDALGSTVTKETINSNKKINTSDYKSGLYFIVFDIPGQKPITRKVIIKH